jgi:hypothetical protein
MMSIAAVSVHANRVRCVTSIWKFGSRRTASMNSTFARTKPSFVKAAPSAARAYAQVLDDRSFADRHK